MKRGQKSYSSDGTQNALHPMEYMNISQGSGGEFSHTGTKAIDYLGWGANGRIYRCPYYAPFDCTCVYKSSDGAGVGWRTDNQVNTPSGKRQITVVFYHDDNTSNYSIGDKRKQGDVIGYTGTAGYATGDHLHLEVFTGQAYASTSIENWEAFFIDGTTLINDYGYDWRLSGDPIGGGYKGTVHCGNRFLNMEEMTDNAQYIMYYLIDKGWTKNAIAGMLGNMQTESTINPCIWQNLSEGNMDLGYGLVQWTPASKYIDWCHANGLKYNDMDSNLKRILYEVEQNIQWIHSSMTFREFTQSTDTPYNLGLLFLSAYERPANPHQPIRGEQAEYWFSVLDSEGWNPPTPTPSKPKHDVNLIHLLLCDALNGWKF